MTAIFISWIAAQVQPDTQDVPDSIISGYIVADEFLIARIESFRNFKSGPDTEGSVTLIVEERLKGTGTSTKVELEYILYNDEAVQREPDLKLMGWNRVELREGKRVCILLNSGASGSGKTACVIDLEGPEAWCMEPLRRALEFESLPIDDMKRAAKELIVGNSLFFSEVSFRTLSRNVRRSDPVWLEVSALLQALARSIDLALTDRRRAFSLVGEVYAADQGNSELNDQILRLALDMLVDAEPPIRSFAVQFLHSTLIALPRTRPSVDRSWVNDPQKLLDQLKADEEARSGQDYRWRELRKYLEEVLGR
jgi:hypothetical protein